MDPLKALVDLMHRLNVTPLHLNFDGPTLTDTRPNIRLWVRTRTEHEALCDALSLKSVEARYDRDDGQRSWSADGDTTAWRLHVACVSHRHHDDWQPKPTKEHPR